MSKLKTMGVFVAIAFILVISIGIYSFITLKDYKDDNAALRNKITELEQSNRDLQQENANFYNNQNNVQTENVSNYDVSAFTKIKAQDIASISKNKRIVVLISRSNCPHCQKYVPVLTQAQKEMNFQTYYLDFFDLEQVQNGQWVVVDEEAVNILKNLPATAEYADFMAEEYGGTPLTLIIENNTLVGGIVGYRTGTSVSTVKSQLQSFGIN